MNIEVKFIIATSWEPNFEEFLASLGGFRGGLGEQLISAIFNALFISSIESKDEFRRFYSVEYSNLSDYLEMRYGKILSEEDLEADRVFLVTWVPQLLDEGYEGNILETVFECIKNLGRGNHEDPT